MGVSLDLEALREVFKDRRSYIAIGKIIETELTSDRSALLARCNVLLQGREVIATVAWDAIGPNAGSISFPQPDDLVLLEFAEGDPDSCYVTRRLSSTVDVLPEQAVGGHMVHRALAGKKLHLLSDTKILLGKGGSDPAQPVPLGTVLQTLLSNILTALASHTHTSAAPGVLTTPPTNASTFTGYKSSPVDNGDILSALAFTEK